MKKESGRRASSQRKAYVEFNYERPGGLGGVGVYTHRRTRLEACLPLVPTDPLLVVNHRVGVMNVLCMVELWN